MAEKNKGKITQVISAVLDIKFPDGKLPDILNAITIDRGNGETLTAEVSQHLGDDTVRCIAMGSTDGLIRGMEAVDTGAPISVPVGEKTLGRIFNVLGEAIDNKPAPEGVEYMPIHRKAPAFEEQSTQTEILETGIKVVFLSIQCLETFCHNSVFSFKISVFIAGILCPAGKHITCTCKISGIFLTVCKECLAGSHSTVTVEIISLSLQCQPFRLHESGRWIKISFLIL